MLLKIMLVLVLAYLAVDFAYSRVVAYRAKSFEKTVERDDAGIRKGFEELRAGEGDVGVLMVHGFGSSPAVFCRMVPELAAAGFECTSMRLPGFGEPLSKYAAVTAEDWEKAIVRELRAMGAPDRPVWLVGHSMGGSLSWNVAKQNPELVRGVVLIAPLFDISSRRSLGISPRRLFPLVDPLLLFTDTFETCFPVDMTDPMVEVLEARDRFVPTSVYRQLFRTMQEARASERVLPRPVLFCVAPRDLVTDADAAVAAYKEVEAPAREIHYAPESGHVIPLDRGWEETTAKVAAFIHNHADD